MAPSPHRSSERSRSARVTARGARSRFALGGAIAALVVLAAGCKKDGVAFECECDWLTDYDDASKLQVRVCAANEQESSSVAKGCAQLAAPAPVQTCACARKQEAGAAPCRQGCLD